MASSVLGMQFCDSIWAFVGYRDLSDGLVGRSAQWCQMRDMWSSSSYAFAPLRQTFYGDCNIKVTSERLTKRTFRLMFDHLNSWHLAFLPLPWSSVDLLPLDSGSTYSLTPLSIRSYRKGSASTTQGPGRKPLGSGLVSTPKGNNVSWELTPAGHTAAWAGLDGVPPGASVVMNSWQEGEEI